MGGLEVGGLVGLLSEQQLRCLRHMSISPSSQHGVYQEAYHCLLHRNRAGHCWLTNAASGPSAAEATHAARWLTVATCCDTLAASPMIRWPLLFSLVSLVTTDHFQEPPQPLSRQRPAATDPFQFRKLKTPPRHQLIGSDRRL